MGIIGDWEPQIRTPKNTWSTKIQDGISILCSSQDSALLPPGVIVVVLLCTATYTCWTPYYVRTIFGGSLFWGSRGNPSTNRALN